MERGDKTKFILKQFKKKSKKLINKDYFTEFFYLNKNRKVIEFITNQDEELIIETFFKKFIPEDFKEFVKLKILNDSEEEIKNWYYTDENLVFVIAINWGFKKQELSIDIDIDNFIITVIDEKGNVMKNIDYTLLNDHLISFLTTQARNLAETYRKIAKK